MFNNRDELFLSGFLAIFGDQVSLNCPMLLKPLYLVSLCCLLVTGGNSVAQSPISPAQHLAGLLQSYHTHRLNDTAYLKAVDFVAPVLLAEDSLPEWLATYRDIVFGDKRWGVYRAHYYTYMAIHATNKNRLWERHLLFREKQ